MSKLKHDTFFYLLLKYFYISFSYPGYGIQWLCQWDIEIFYLIYTICGVFVLLIICYRPTKVSLAIHIKFICTKSEEAIPIQFITWIQNIFGFCLQIIRDPKVLRVRTKAIFQTICFLLTVFMSVSFVNRYMENENSTRIIYKKFHEKSEDKYPTYSVCFKGTNFHWFNGLDIYNAFELRVEQYEMMLKGNLALRYEYDSSLKLFRKVPTLISNGTNVDSMNFM